MVKYRTTVLTEHHHSDYKTFRNVFTLPVPLLESGCDLVAHWYSQSKFYDWGFRFQVTTTHSMKFFCTILPHPLSVVGPEPWVIVLWIEAQDTTTCTIKLFWEHFPSSSASGGIWTTQSYDFESRVTTVLPNYLLYKTLFPILFYPLPMVGFEPFISGLWLSIVPLC